MCSVDELIPKNTFGEMIKNKNFCIPAYQRAYSWQDKQIEQFLTDLTSYVAINNPYYLGHYIFEKDQGDETYYIIDGQQRMTTIALFFSVCRYLQVEHLPFLNLSVVEYDRESFQNALENIEETIKRLEKPQTSSMERVIKAIKKIYDFMKDKDIKKYINVISNAMVSIGEYEGKVASSQIFELHNTRGIPLTEVEKCKATLLKHVYMYGNPADAENIREAFAKIYSIEERAADVSFRGEMSLEDILAHHLRAVDGEQFNEPRTNEGKEGCHEYILLQLAKRGSDVSYAVNLAREFAKSMEIITEDIVKADKHNPVIGDTILLDQRRGMIFLLKYFRLTEEQRGKHDEMNLFKLWESFLFMWDFHGYFYNLTYREQFREIFKTIGDQNENTYELIKKYSSGEIPFAPNKAFAPSLNDIFVEFHNRKSEKLYKEAYGESGRHNKYKYWLYKYEICNNAERQDHVRHTLRKLFKENDVTLDHIIAQELEWPYLSPTGEEHDKDIEKWSSEAEKKYAKRTWKEIGEYINGIGNLCLLSRSVNASIQTKPPTEKKYETRGLDFGIYQDAKTWKNPCQWKPKDNNLWVNKMQKRGEKLLDWALGYFRIQ